MKIKLLKKLRKEALDHYVINREKFYRGELIWRIRDVGDTCPIYSSKKKKEIINKMNELVHEYVCAKASDMRNDKDTKELIKDINGNTQNKKYMKRILAGFVIMFLFISLGTYISNRIESQETNMMVGIFIGWVSMGTSFIVYALIDKDE